MKMMTLTKQVLMAACTFFTLAACSGSGSDEPDVPTPPTPTPDKKLPININTTLSTRVANNAFEAGDKIGLFVVNQKADGSAGTLTVTGNHVDNMQYTYNGTWTPATPVYWKDNTTHADFYLYYPYTSTVSSVEAMPYNISADQSNTANFKAADLLIGKATNVAPTENAVKIDAKHAMSQIGIKLVAGNGFTDESLRAAQISIKVNRLKTNATANLSTGVVTARGDDADIIPLKESDNNYKAIIVPQAVGDGSLITVNVDGRDFNLAKSAALTAFEAGRNYQFTVTLSKTSNGVNVNITNWENDGIDYGGTAE